MTVKVQLEQTALILGILALDSGLAEFSALDNLHDADYTAKRGLKVDGIALLTVFFRRAYLSHLSYLTPKNGKCQGLLQYCQKNFTFGGCKKSRADRSRDESVYLGQIHVLITRSIKSKL